LLHGVQELQIGGTSLTAVADVRNFSFGAFVVEAAFLGDRAAFALGDGSVRLCAGETTEVVQVHSGPVLSAAPTRDGKALLTGGDDGRVALVAAGGAVEVVGERPRKWIDHVTAGPAGSLAFASGRQVVVRFADRRERELTLDRTAGDLDFAPKGMRLAVAGYDGVTLWWPATDAEPSRLAFKGAHLSVRFSPDGRFLVTAMQENALHAWRVEDGLDMHMSGYPAKTRSLAWTVKGRHLATSGAHAAVLWPFQSKEGPMGKDPLQLGTREALVTRVACHPRGETIAIGYQDGAVMLTAPPDAPEVVLRADGAPISALCFNAAGGRLAFGDEAGAVGLVEIEQ
jgi:WD40 repeat protein